jgi:hypothetical protein
MQGTVPSTLSTSCVYIVFYFDAEKHIMHQHLSGLYNRIPQGYNQEDIAKWKAERRKNYPTG